MKKNLDKRKLTRPKKIFIGITAFLVVCLSVAIGYRLYLYLNPLVTMEFQQYAPTKSLDGMTIKSKVITILTSHGRPTDKSLDMDFNRNDSHISQSLQTESSEPIDICKRYDTPKDKNDCIVNQTPKGIKYHYEISSFNYIPMNQSVAFVIGDTYIYVDVNIEPKKGKTIPIAEWEAFIDSFQPVFYDNLKTQYLDSSFMG